MNGDALGRLLEESVPTDGAGVMFARGATVPTDATAGYAVGCLFVHTDNASEADILYVNIGTATSCNFNAVTVAAD